MDELPKARLCARCASLLHGNDSWRQLQGGRSDTSTQCQGQRHGDDSVTLKETLPPWACYGLRAAGPNNISDSTGALVTGNGANAEEAATAKLPWQDNVNAAVVAAWLIPPFCKHLAVSPSCLMGPRAHTSQPEKCNPPAKGHAELGVHREGGTPTLRQTRKITCNCDNGVYMYDQFGSRVLLGVFVENWQKEAHVKTNCTWKFCRGPEFKTLPYRS